MEATKNIFSLVEDYRNGLAGEGPILWHKKGHRRGSGDFACLRGIYENCSSPINCPSCYKNNEGLFCLEKGGQTVGGVLGVEEKHSNLVDELRSGAYASIKDALESDLKEKIR